MKTQYSMGSSYYYQNTVYARVGCTELFGYTQHDKMAAG